MKPLKIISFTRQFFLLVICLHVLISCKEKSAAQTPVETETIIETVTETTVDTPTELQTPTVGVANFEAGINAANVNNMPLAFKEFLIAAKEGHVFAEFNVGLMYEQGLGVEKDVHEAFYWYEKSAEQGNSAAQFNLGVCYENGIGNSIDYEKANEWYRKAAVQGDGLAIGNLGMLYIRAQGVKENKVAGVALLIMSTTVDASPENLAKTNISATRGLTADMVSEAQALSEELINAERNFLVPFDQYLNASEH